MRRGGAVRRRHVTCYARYDRARVDASPAMRDTPRLQDYHHRDYPTAEESPARAAAADVYARCAQSARLRRHRLPYGRCKFSMPTF